MTVSRQIEMSELLPETETEAMLIKQLGAEPSHIDEVCQRSGIAGGHREQYPGDDGVKRAGKAGRHYELCPVPRNAAGIQSESGIDL